MYTHEGKQYARVTEILAELSDFSSIPTEVIQHKGLIGTWTHLAIDDEIHGRYPYIPIELRREVEPYFYSFLRWRDRLNIKFIETSKRYYNDEIMVTGELDALIMYEGNELPTLIDYKTSASENPISWPRQAHFYHYLIEAHGKKVRPAFCFIKLSKTGSLPKVIEYKYDEKIRKECLERAKRFWENLSIDNNHEA